MGILFRQFFILILAVILISDCSSARNVITESRGFIGEISDPSEYSRIMEEAGDISSLAHFPADIPENAELIRFHYHPSVFQGGSALQLRVKLPAHKIEAIRSEFIDEAKYVFSSEVESGDNPEGGEQRTTVFYTSDDGSFEWPESYEILVLDSEYLGSDDAPWNHGISYGLAVSLTNSEVVYWYEDW